MFLEYESENRYFCKCESCLKTNAMIKKEDCTEENGILKLPSPLPCKWCGNISDTIQRENSDATDNIVKCPKCKSTQLTAGNKGFGLGKAVVGGILLANPVGLLGGFIGSKKLMISCLKCGHTWEAGK